MAPRIDYSNSGLLIVQMATLGHEIGGTLFKCATLGSQKHWPSESRLPEFCRASSLPLPNVEVGETAAIELENGCKGPDFMLYDAMPGQNPVFRKHPTVVCEVAFFETTAKLAEDCGRWIACSLGRVQLAVGIDINLEKEMPGKGYRDIADISCYLWELTKAELLEKIPPGDTLNSLVRSDKYKNCQMYTNIPAAASFYCISAIERKGKSPAYVRYDAGVTDKILVWQGYSSSKSKANLIALARFYQKRKQNRRISRFSCGISTANLQLSMQIKPCYPCRTP